MHKKKNKLTREVLLQIQNLVKTMPKLHKTNDDGSLKFIKVPREMLGRDLPKSMKDEKGNPLKANKKYKMIDREPVLIDHLERLIDAYQTTGQDGIQAHINWVNEVLEMEKELDRQALEEGNRIAREEAENKKMELLIKKAIEEGEYGKG